jgi:hypothetical protein
MKYTIKESELKSLVRKHIVEALRQRKKRSNEDRLKQFIKESVKRVIKESAQASHEEIWNKIKDSWKWAQRDATSGKQIVERFTGDLAWQIMPTYNLTIDDLKEYGNVLDVVDINLLKNEIKSYEEATRREKIDDERRSAEAWAEGQMSDMGFGFEGD